jgi:hypothetical protein
VKHVCPLGQHAGLVGFLTEEPHVTGATAGQVELEPAVPRGQPPL